MIKKKICMVGAFAVGKTSLVQQYVNSIFSDKYHTTIGVKIDQKKVTINDKEINLVLWDIHGEDEFQKVKSSYLIGAAGYFLVIDGTRANTIDVALGLQNMIKNKIGDIPVIALINKKDLTEEWELTDADIEKLKAQNFEIIYTSAKTGEGVEEAFTNLTQKIVS